ncbi:MAG: hypothetical protein CMK41_05275 [Porticoccaceae bacterium]|nr:hypothetical protein [Porticoccaceae bacterium]|tara:strand:+ start:365 stop:1492 length:1128 start_codon:yes stop_codon:yes gene_type:complete
MRRTLQKIFILFVFSGYAVGQNENLTRSELIETFKAEQKCVADASEEENWGVVTPCAKKSLTILEDLLGQDHKSVALITYEYGLALRYNRNFEESSEVLKRAVMRYGAEYGKNSPELVPILLDYALAVNQTGDFERNSPINIYSRAFKIFKSTEDFDPLEYANMVSDAVSELLKKNNFIYQKYTRTTLRVAKEALKIYSEALGLENEKTAALNFNIGKLELAQNRSSNIKASIKYLRDATKNKEIAPFAYAFLIRAYEENKQSDLATEFLYKLAEIQQTGLKSNSDFYPIFIPKPDYPDRARRNGTEGYVILELTVNETGNPINISVLEENPEKSGFGKEAKEAANGLRYIPKVINGKALEVKGVLYKYTFNMAK